MHSLSLVLAALAASQAAASHMFDKRGDITWGPGLGFGPSKEPIISAVTTTYPGEMPQGQVGGLFLWVGLSNGTGDLVQSIIGSYAKGESECTGRDADSNW